MKQMTRRLTSGLSALVLVFFLAACSGLSGFDGGATPTPTHTPTPTPVPTQTAIGTGFTIGYPTDWTAQSSGQMGIDMVGSFVDMMNPLQVNAVSVFTAPSDPSLTNMTNDQAATTYTYGSSFLFATQPHFLIL